MSTVINANMPLYSEGMPVTVTVVCGPLGVEGVLVLSDAQAIIENPINATRAIIPKSLKILFLFIRKLLC